MVEAELEMDRLEQSAPSVHLRTGHQHDVVSLMVLRRENLQEHRLAGARCPEHDTWSFAALDRSPEPPPRIFDRRSGIVLRDLRMRQKRPIALLK